MLHGLPPILPADPQRLWQGLDGYTVRPGLVDLHGDGFERHLAPRRGVMKDLGDGLAALDAELAANGITTAVLAQFWSWEGGIRSPDFARRLLLALDAARADLATDMRVQLRVEISLVSDFDEIASLVAQHAIPMVVFNDHLPRAALNAGKRPPRLTGQALKSGRSPEAHLALLHRLNAVDHKAELARFAASLTSDGVVLGSHDDSSAQTRARYRALGAHVSEFPETEDAVQAARAGGDVIVLGAPNVVRGGSHDKGISAQAQIAAGRCDVLVSDYHYPALRQAALNVQATDTDAWHLVSRNPASVLGLTDRGTLQAGQRSDLVVLDRAGRPAGTMVAGQWSYLSGPLISRLAQQTAP